MAGSEMDWLNGWPRVGTDAVLIGSGVYCAGCGRPQGITTVAVDADWVRPERDPDWPFPEDSCPVHTRPAEPRPAGEPCGACGGSGVRTRMARM